MKINFEFTDLHFQTLLWLFAIVLFQLGVILTYWTFEKPEFDPFSSGQILWGYVPWVFLLQFFPTEFYKFKMAMLLKMAVTVCIKFLSFIEYEIGEIFLSISAALQEHMA